MSKLSKEILVIEFGSWHDECLYSICLLLKHKGFRVTLAANEKLKERLEISLPDVVDERIYFSFGSNWDGWKALKDFYFFLRKGHFTHVYLNTAQGNIAWKFFLLPLPKNIQYWGTLHNVKKLRKSYGQRIITHKINGYLLLSELLTPSYEASSKKPMVVSYPVFYPKHGSMKLMKPKDEIWIIVPGAVDFSRRDYHVLLTSTEKNYNKKIKFILLGNIRKKDGPVIQQQIKDKHLEEHFITFSNFVPDEEFYSYVNLCDYVLPLVNPKDPVYSKYVTDKISGTYNLAIAFRKPMLCQRELEVYEDFKDTSFFYDNDQFVEFINHLTPNPDVSKLYQLKKWTLKEQEQQLKNWLEYK